MHSSRGLKLPPSNMSAQNAFGHISTGAPVTRYADSTDGLRSISAILNRSQIAS